MNKNLTYRKATLSDLPKIVALLCEDELGQMRESQSSLLNEKYVEAFHKIDADPHQYLMIVQDENNEEIVGTCHLYIRHSLTFIGSTRMHIDAVRVAKKYRGQNIGSWMFHQAILYGMGHGASIVQLMTNKQRQRAQFFYEKLGFQASHEGMTLHLKKG